jgi:dipeptidyl aminopeptidase/acylaminoacyl peptidase
VPKGRAWRKSVYRNIGRVNIRDQALAAREFLKRPYADTSRVAVWGWSGGGSATLNLLFQYPDIYQTGIAVAAVGSQLTYDNIYQERYMGLPRKTGKISSKAPRLPTPRTCGATCSTSTARATTTCTTRTPNCW